MKEPSTLSIEERARRLLDGTPEDEVTAEPPAATMPPDAAAMPAAPSPPGMGPIQGSGGGGPVAVAGPLPATGVNGVARRRRSARLVRTSIRMRATLGWLPMWLAVSTVFGMYVLGNGGVFGAVSTMTGAGFVLAGFAVGIIGWMSAAMATAGDADADRANPRSFSALVARIDDAHATVRGLVRAGILRADDGIVLNLLALRRRLAANPPEPDWATGIGYVVAWRDLHHVEEALIDFTDPSHLPDLLEFDRSRIAGSKLDTSTGHLRELITDTDKHLKASEWAQARPGLRAIRSTVNDYRDRRFEALVRGRIHVEQVSLLLGLAAWALLSLAILAEATRPAVTAVSALYLVGAAAGLFTQLRSRVSESVEDVFGYGGAELRQVIVMSGLAAVAGVFLTAMAGATTQGDTTLDVGKAFTFSAISVATAAAFGLAPGTAARRLSAWADANLKDLESTTANGAHG